MGGEGGGGKFLRFATFFEVEENRKGKNSSSDYLDNRQNNKDNANAYFMIKINLRQLDEVISCLVYIV